MRINHVEKVVNCLTMLCVFALFLLAGTYLGAGQQQQARSTLIYACCLSAFLAVLYFLRREEPRPASSVKRQIALYLGEQVYLHLVAEVVSATEILDRLGLRPRQDRNTGAFEAPPRIYYLTTPAYFKQLDQVRCGQRDALYVPMTEEEWQELQRWHFAGSSRHRIIEIPDGPTPLY